MNKVLKFSNSFQIPGRFQEVTCLASPMDKSCLQWPPFDELDPAEHLSVFSLGGHLGQELSCWEFLKSLSHEIS